MLNFTLFPNNIMRFELGIWSIFVIRLERYVCKFGTWKSVSNQAAYYMEWRGPHPEYRSVFQLCVSAPAGNYTYLIALLQCPKYLARQTYEIWWVITNTHVGLSGNLESSACWLESRVSGQCTILTCGNGWDYRGGSGDDCKSNNNICIQKIDFEPDS